MLFIVFAGFIKGFAGFVGAKFSSVFVQGLNMMPEKSNDLMSEGREKIDKLMGDKNE